VSSHSGILSARLLTRGKSYRHVQERDVPLYHHHLRKLSSSSAKSQVYQEGGRRSCGDMGFVLICEGCRSTIRTWTWKETCACKWISSAGDYRNVGLMCLPSKPEISCVKTGSRCCPCSLSWSACSTSSSNRESENLRSGDAAVADRSSPL
jgi:hypothetical protein